jgi:hypothetical protein
MKNIRTRNFWPKDDVSKKFVINLINECSPEGSKVIVTSVFTGTSLIRKMVDTVKIRSGITLTLESQQRRSYNLVTPFTGKEILNIWYTGENLRPPSETYWDATLSFEADYAKGRNIYLPFWATTLGENIEEAKRNQEHFLISRAPIGQWRRFACAVISNPEPSRMRAIHELKEVGELGLFGNIFKRPVNNKLGVLQEYTFNICFENDLYPGYVTEKALESWQAGCIPIWWGLDPAGYLNEKALINFADLGFENGVSQVKRVLGDRTELLQMQSEPILRKPYDFDQLRSTLREYLNYK